jgi:NAD+ synthase
MSLDVQKASAHIIQWLLKYCQTQGMKGFVVGVSGGVDSALVSTLCAKTHLPTLLVQMPIRQSVAENQRAAEHIRDLQQKFSTVSAQVLNLEPILLSYEQLFQNTAVVESHLNMANLRARIRMSTLYALAGANQYLVAGTGNKIEDFGVGFFTKYGDGGVDISPIGDLYKSEVFALAKHLAGVPSILQAPPTDGLFADGRTDEDQLGASYADLEWAMQWEEKSAKDADISEHQAAVLKIYQLLNGKNKHKMNPIPLCLVGNFR